MVDATHSGVLVDPTDPAAIAAGIRAVLDVTANAARRRRRRIRAAGQELYTWEAQEVALLSVYSRLLGKAPMSRGLQPAANRIPLPLAAVRGLMNDERARPAPLQPRAARGHGRPRLVPRGSQGARQAESLVQRGWEVDVPA